MSLWYLQFFQKNERKNRPHYYGTSSRTVFICFLEELKSPKRHFEINWPLGCFIEDQKKRYQNYSEVAFEFSYSCQFTENLPNFQSLQAHNFFWSYWCIENSIATSEWTWSFYNLAHNRVLLHCIGYIR